jgi:hypothetical protein
MNTALVPSRRSPCFTCTAFFPFRRQTPSVPPTRFLTLPLSGGRFLLTQGLGFTIAPQARHTFGPNRVRSRVLYGPGLHLPLLRTPPPGDALMFGYRPESACLTRTLTSLAMHARRRTEPRRPHAATGQRIAGSVLVRCPTIAVAAWGQAGSSAIRKPSAPGHAAHHLGIRHRQPACVQGSAPPAGLVTRELPAPFRRSVGRVRSGLL